MMAIYESHRDPGDETAPLNGFWLRDLQPSQALKIQTHNTRYYLRKNSDGSTFFIQGHQAYCPVSVLCTVNGSSEYRGVGLRAGYVGVGNHLEFNLRYNGRIETVITSPIKSVEVVR